MASEKLGCAVFAITAVILALSSLNLFNTQENFTDVSYFGAVQPKAAPNMQAAQPAVVQHQVAHAQPAARPPMLMQQQVAHAQPVARPQMMMQQQVAQQQVARAPMMMQQPASSNVIQKYTSAPSLSSATALENYQDSLVMNVGTSVEDVNKSGAQYYLNLQNYLNPGVDNLELAQNISARPIVGGVPLPGAAEYYSNNVGDGFVSNLGELNGQYYPSVNYSNDRAMQLSNCAKDLPMFAASSLLPKPSVNADNNALSQSAARALAAFTALSPAEQIGAITSNGTPYSKTSDYRALDQISTNNMQTPMFGASPALYIPPTYGQVNSYTDQAAPSGLVNALPPPYANM